MKQWEVSRPWVWLFLAPLIAMLGVVAGDLAYFGHPLFDLSHFFFGAIIGFAGGAGRLRHLRPRSLG